MKKKEIIQKTLRAYNKVIKTIKEKRLNKDRSLLFLQKNNIQIGVCYFLDKKLDITGSFPWITKYKSVDSNGGTDWSISYWAKTPARCNTRKEILESLEKRKEILFTELKTCKK